MYMKSEEMYSGIELGTIKKEQKERERNWKLERES